MNRKGVAVLAAEPDTKRGREQPESSKSSRPFCAFHNLHSHNTKDCQVLRAIREGRFGRRHKRNAGATAEEEDMVADAGTTVAPATGGAAGLVRTAGRISLARVPGGINLVRIILKATPDPPRCRHRQEGMANM